jgi:hypothetical protein
MGDENAEIFFISFPLKIRRLNNLTLCSAFFYFRVIMCKISTTILTAFLSYFMFVSSFFYRYLKLVCGLFCFCLFSLRRNHKNTKNSFDILLPIYSFLALSRFILILFLFTCFKRFFSTFFLPSLQPLNCPTIISPPLLYIFFS